MQNNLITSLAGSGLASEAAGMIANYDEQWLQAIQNQDEEKPDIITNASGTLRHEDFQRIQDKLVEVRRRQLNGILDLQAAGLTVPESIETQLVGFENVNEFQAAKISMNPTDEQNNDTIFTDSYVPLPIIHQSWRIPYRQRNKQYKQFSGMTASFRKVSEKAESMLFIGAPEITVTVGGTQTTVYGYTTHPNRQTDTISNWSLTATTGETILDDALGMLSLMFTENSVSAPDSVMLYVGNSVWLRLQDDFKAASDKSIINRLKEISSIKDIKPAEKLGTTDVLMVELSENTIELAVASDIVTIPHTITRPLGDQVFTTYSAMVPLIKVDSNSKTGIVHGTV